ncbi:MAG: type II toxin-antitoxin system VapC family toxin [Blastocatellia bacterium]|nr:type II toxin-antitoxin system VapC family toxin [Blastocatellia bacterium]
MIESVVIDTDVMSFLFKQDSRAALYRPHLAGKLTVISFMTLAEMNRWSLEKNWGAARKYKLEEFLEDFIVLYSSRAMCFRWAEAINSSRRKGRPIQTADAWIAATALLHGIPLVTHNGKHYASVDGLTVISETGP